MLPDSVQFVIRPSFRPATPPMASRPFIVPLLAQRSITWFSPLTPTMPPTKETRSVSAPGSSDSAFAASSWPCVRRYAARLTPVFSLLSGNTPSAGRSRPPAFRQPTTCIRLCGSPQPTMPPAYAYARMVILLETADSLPALLESEVMVTVCGLVEAVTAPGTLSPFSAMPGRRAYSALPARSFSV